MIASSQTTTHTPRIVDADVNFDIYPSASPPRLEARGTYLLENKTTAPITEVLLSVDAEAKIEALSVGTVTTPKQQDAELNVRVFAPAFQLKAPKEEAFRPSSHCSRNSVDRRSISAKTDTVLPERQGRDRFRAVDG